ncbi:MAG TPA: response regulator transcription factor [Candidatus Obscuribacterales bacterium]
MIRVMIVDDQSLVRQGLISLLSQEGDIEIVGEAGNGSEAISLLDSLRPDVILMDMRMPALDGVAATREILKRQPAMRIIVLTTFDDDEYIFESLKAGALGYLLKDSEPEIVANAIRAVHKGHTQLGPTIGQRVISRVKAPASKESAELAKFLTERELEVLKLMADGSSNKDIADKLSITEGTVKHHISSILTQLGAKNRTEAALWARDNLA